MSIEERDLAIFAAAAQIYAALIATGRFGSDVEAARALAAREAKRLYRELGGFVE